MTKQEFAQQNNLFSKIKHYCSDNYFNLVLLVFSIVFFSVVMGLVGANFFSRLGIELCEGFKDDGGIYYAVGKGIAHGLRPYIDLYETKGPILFYLCALAYVISPNFIFMNILSFITLLVIALAPVVVVTYRFIKKKDYNWPLYLSYVFCFFSIGLLLATYTQRNCGRGYSEMYAVCFLIIYFTLIYIADSNKTKFYSPTIIISSIFLMMSIFTKETFSLIAIVGCLFICKNKKDFIYKFLTTFVYAGIIAIIFMGSAGILPAYFNIYLRSILFKNTTPALNAMLATNSLGAIPTYFRIDIVILTMWGFSKVLTILLMLAFAISYYWLFTQKYCTKNEVLLALDIIRRLLLAIYSFFITTICMSIGTIYWAHLRPIGVPLYLLLFFVSFDVIFAIKDIKIKKFTFNANSACSFALCITACVGVFLMPKFNYNARTYAGKTGAAKLQALYVDQICDALGESRYQYLGMIDNRFYAYTKHDPMGPAFIQTKAMFRNEHNYLCQQFIIQIQTVNVVFVKAIRCGAINGWVKLYLQTHFTSIVPEKCIEIERPLSWTGVTLFRIGKFD